MSTSEGNTRKNFLKKENFLNIFFGIVYLFKFAKIELR